MGAEDPALKAGAVLEASLYVSDLAAAEKFYRDVLGLDVIGRTEGRHVFLRCGATVVLLFNAEATEVPPAPGARLPVPPHGARGTGHLCFRADGQDIERWKRHLEERGVAVEAEVDWPASGGSARGGRSIYFRDPAGNSLEFAPAAIWGL